MQKLSFEIPRNVKGTIEPRRITDSMFKEICDLTSFVIGDRKTLGERIYCINNNITVTPICECGKQVKYTKNGYRSFCSVRCAQNSTIIREKIKQTCVERHGVEYPSQSKTIRIKIKQTLIDNYGVENPSQSNEIRQKIVNTYLERYFVEHPLQSITVKSKIKNTCLKKYGVENVFQSDEIQKKIVHTCIKRYGVENPSQATHIKHKKYISLSKHYQQRRNTECADYSGIVYILYFKELQLVKIGLTNNFSERSKGLIKDFGDFEIIKLIETETCFALEKELHDRFDEYRVSLSNGGGKTEFFNECILQCDISEFLNRN